MGLRREMHDGIDPFLGHDVRDQVGGGDVPLDEFEVFETDNVIEVGEAGAVVQFVVDYDVVVGVLFRKEDGYVGPDEAYAIRGNTNDKHTLEMINVVMMP